MIIYPQKPWADGQTFQHTASDGSVLTGVYDSGKNVWTFYRTNEDGSGAGALVTTADVKTLNVRPSTVKDPRDATLITTQQDANWWIIDDLNKRARKPIISDTEPTYYPLYDELPDKELIEGDIWIDNHEGRAFTPMYYWTGTKWEELEHDENFDEQLKEHTCVQFYKKVASSNDVDAKEGHFCAFYDFGSSVPGERKWWTSPAGKGFFNNGDKIYVNDQGPYVLEQLVDAGRWTTFFLPGSPQPPNGTTVKFSKIPKLCDTSFNDDRYVKQTGDTMTGDLRMKDANLDFVSTGESLKDGNGDPILIDHNDGNGLVEQWDSANDRFRHIESLPPQLIKSDGTSSADTKTPFGIRVEIDDGNTFKNQFKVGNRNGDAVTIAGGTGPEVKFGKNFPGNQDPQTGDPHWAPNNAGGVKITGIPTPTKENPDGSLAVNKEYVDTETAFLQNEIIELEEELEAIIPSLERGVWKMTLSGIISGPGLITFYDDTFGNGSPTGLFTAAKSIWFHKNDNGGVPHGFNDVEAGNLLELFVQGSAEFGLYEVVEVHDQTHLANPYWAIDVSFVRTLENTSAADNGELLRLKTFAAPSGGNASEFVLKTGDKMSGDLTMVKDPFNNGDVSPKIEFKSKRDDGTVFTNALSMPYDTGNTLKATGTFESGGAIYSGGAISASGNLQYNSSTRMYLGSTADTHYLGFGTSTNYQAIQWDKSNGLVQIRAKDSYGSNGQVLTKTSSGVEWATPASPGGGMYWGRKYVYDSSTSGTPSSGRFKVHSGFLYINEIDVDGNQLRHTAGDFNWQIPFYVFATSSNHILMASLLGTGSDYTGSGYMRIKTSGWNSNSLTNSQVYYTHLTGFW